MSNVRVSNAGFVRFQISMLRFTHNPAIKEFDVKRRYLIALSLLASLPLAAQNWPQWRGPARDGAITGFNEPAAWPDKLKQQWKIEVGAGYATPLLVGDRIYMFSRQGEEEVMQALEAATGKTISSTPSPAPFHMTAR